MLPQAVSDHYRAQQRLIVATLGLTRREWAQMGTGDFDAGWQRVGPRVTLLTASAQLGAASAGAAYVPAVLEELGQPVVPAGDVNSRAFAGTASDGRPLDTLLYGAVVKAKESGPSTATALRAGGKWLDMAVHTMVQDAGRGAAGVAITARPTVEYVRMVNSPCCSRCAVLAGRVYRFNTGFQRHPRCDCYHVPTTVPRSIRVPEIPLDRITGLSAADRQALNEGADLGQVVNARRGASGMTTTEGTSRHGLARQRLGQGKQRLTPDGIYRISSDRDEATRLLRQHGYLL